jgi:D-citramalate synthase
MIARLSALEKSDVDRLEVASARVSEGEKEAVRMICNYAEPGRICSTALRCLGFVDH